MIKLRKINLLNFLCTFKSEVGVTFWQFYKVYETITINTNFYNTFFTTFVTSILFYEL